MDDLIRPNLSRKGEEALRNEAIDAGNTQKMLEAAKGGLGAYDQLQEYYKGARQAEIDTQDKAARDVLTAEEIAQFPEEIRGEMETLYNGYLSKVFEQERVKVGPKDPEWMYIQAEMEDPTSSLSRTMIAATEAAREKKQRLMGETKQQSVEKMYKAE